MNLIIRKIIIIFSFIFTFISLSYSQSDLETVVSWLSGSFSSSEQAAMDSDFFDIRLQMIPIWKNYNRGYWIYVEQAVATHLERPYRQRVYHLTIQGDLSIKSDVFALPDPLRFAGDWKKPEPLSELSPDSLIERQGCAVILKKQKDGSFSGSTVSKECVSTLRGASYATSEVTITPDKIISWDRGFDSNDKQIWGAVKGGYIFKKIKK